MEVALVKKAHGPVHYGKTRASEKPRRPEQPCKEILEKTSGLWPENETLFTPIPVFAKKALENFPAILEKVWPLKKRHKEKLPEDIADLSRKLTTDRKSLEKNYWSHPENISAYLYYFLPWNLLRFLSLLPNLPLGAPTLTEQTEIPVIYDAGSGPLALPIALWLAKPEWRKSLLRIVALDKAKKPLALGKAIFEELGRLCNERTWQVEIESGTLFALPEIAKNQGDYGKTYPFLICAANILNELPLPAVFQKYHSESLDCILEQLEEEPEKEEEKFYALLDSWQPLLSKARGKGKLLFVEPGTRLGGASIMLLRKAAHFFGLSPLSPCTHSRTCPLIGAFSKSSAAYRKNWCHFTFPAVEAPDWLARLSRESGLEKSSLSLSFALFSDKKTSRSSQKPRLSARVISGSFKVPDMRGQARYACSEKGALLLENGISLQRGALTEIDFPEKPERDKKSGAFRIMTPKTTVNSVGRLKK